MIRNPGALPNFKSEFLSLTLKPVKVLLPLFGLFVFSLELNAQTSRPALVSPEKNQRTPLSLLHEKKKVLIGVLEKQESDWNRGDLKSFLAAYWNSDTLRSVSVRGLQYGWDRLQGNLSRTFPDSASMGHLDYDVIHIEMIGDNDALLTGKWLRKNDKKFRGGYFSILLRKINGRWLIVAEHFG